MELHAAVQQYNTPNRPIRATCATLKTMETRGKVPVSVASSSHGVLFLSVAVSTTDRQFSRLVALFHADERPIFNGLKSASIARSVARYGWVFLLVASNTREAFWLLMRPDWTVMIFIWWTTDDVAKEVQSSVGYDMRERLATRDVSDFNIGHMYGKRN